VIADVAIIAVTLVCLARELADYRIRMRQADRVRLVPPPAVTAGQSEDKP
jgi:hypothetical protein